MKYRIEYLTCKGKWHDHYGRLLTKEEADRYWNILLGNFKYTPGRKMFRMLDENGKDVDE